MSIQNDIQTKTLELKNILGNISDDPSITLEKKTQIIVHGTALVCAIIAVQPLPFADLFILTPIQIVMVISLSRALGNPLSDTGAKEIVSYLIGVVGWGVLAQQTILGLYKTIIPFAGGFTTIPLVYATTFGLGIASKAILEAKMKGNKISNAELKRITKEAKEKIKKESKIEWTPKGLKKEWEVISKQSKEYEEYKRKLNYYESEFLKYEQKLKDKDKENELLKNGEIDNLIFNKINTLKNRFMEKYTNIEFTPTALNSLVILSNDKLKLVEYEIGNLQHYNNPKSRKLIDERIVKDVGIIYYIYKNSKMIIQFFEAVENMDKESFILDLYRKNTKLGTVRHIRNEEIRQIFINTIKESKEQINICSPWITGYVVDDELIKLFKLALERGVVIKILYGISDGSESDERKMYSTEKVAKEMKDTFSVYGQNFRMERTNTHCKLLISDENYFVEGSYNFLSFKGNYDKNTRNEAAVYCKNTELLKELRESYFSF